MITADWVALGAVALFLLVGMLAGFGKGLKIFTSGIFGVIISVFVCYILGGMILQLEFVQTLLDRFRALLIDKNGFCDFLLDIHIDIVVYYVALFIVVQIIRIIIVVILKNIAEIDNPVFRFINKTLGAIFFVTVLVFIALLVFQIISWIGGSTAENFGKLLEDSFFKLDWVFNHNPLLSLKDRVSEIIAGF